MKTTNQITTTTTTSRTYLLSTRFTLLLAAFVMALGIPSLVAGGSVPFKGSGEGAVVSSEPVPEGVLLRTVATGRATHIGEFTREEELVLNPATGTLVGTLVYTAANGDQLFGDVAAQFTSPTTVVGTIIFTGGTGRFVNATGEADAIVSTADGVHFTVEFEGSISSIGANK